jgi:hypothetical protein
VTCIMGLPSHSFKGYIMRVMFDSANSNIPENANLVLFYGNGRYANEDKLRESHPGAQLIGCDVNGSAPSMTVLDYEAGDVDSPETAVNWVKDKLQVFGAESQPTWYSSQSDYVTLASAAHLAGFTPGEDLFHIIAAPGASPELIASWAKVPGVVGVQNKWGTDTGYDVTQVFAGGWQRTAPLLTGVPAGLLVAPSTQTARAVLRWSAPDHRSARGYYSVQVERLDPKGWVLCEDFRTADDSVALSDLFPRTIYRWRASDGNWSGWQQFVTP